MAEHRGPRPDRTPLLLVVSALLVLASGSALVMALVVRGGAAVGGSVGGSAVAASDDASRTAARDSVGTAARAMPNWVDVLAELDRRRAAAFAAASPRMLRGVYVAGSAPLRADRRLVRGYRRGGVRVEGLRIQVVDVRLLAARGDRAVLRVRDRVAGGSAVRRDGATRALAADGWTTHRIVLQRTFGGWRIARIH